MNAYADTELKPKSKYQAMRSNHTAKQEYRRK